MFDCPKCEKTNSQSGRYFIKVNYLRCEHCNIGVYYKTPFLSAEGTVSGTYIPQKSVKSPKTGKILDSETAYKSPIIYSYIYDIFPFTSESSRLKKTGH
jgi:hypothetical protein